MEPERKIEKWLRAYAKKRHSQTDDSFKIHPAARRLLQSEISRSAPKPQEDDETIPLWQAVRQMWAFLLGFGICVFSVAAIFFQSLHEEKKKAELAGTLGNLKQINTAMQMAAGENNGRLPATLDSLTNGSLAKEDLTDSQNHKPFVYLGAGKNLNYLPSNSVLAYSQEQGGKHAVLFADGRTAFLNKKDFAAQTNQLSSQVALAEAAKPRTAEAPAAFDSVQPTTALTPPAGTQTPTVHSVFYRQVQSSGEGSTQTFASLDQFDKAAAQNAFKKTAASSRPLPVLMNFQVQQNGNAIRIVDQDGSVYSGSLLSSVNSGAGGGLPANNVETDNTLASKSVEGNVNTNTALAPPGAGPNTPQTAPNYSFRVNGFNRTLKQSVEFTGNLLANLAVAQNVRQTFGTSANMVAGADYLQSRMKMETTNQPGPLPWFGLRISGTAVVDHTNQIEINATPVAPAKN